MTNIIHEKLEIPFNTNDELINFLLMFDIEEPSADPMEASKAYNNTEL